MVNIIIKTDEQKAYERKILNDFTPCNTAENREYAECIAARTKEALKELRRYDRN